jgi:hypothetical protein
MDFRTMRTKYLSFSLLALCLCVICGCDMFRSLAGRPTSDQIEQRKVLISLRQKAEQARADSLQKAQKHLADSLAAIDSIRGCGMLVRTPAEARGLSSVGLGKRYYVILGTFSESANADAFSRKFPSGSEPEVFRLRNGFSVVTACQSDDPQEFFARLQQLRSSKLVSSDAWIYVNEQ